MWSTQVIVKSEMFLPRSRMDMQMVRSRSNFDDDCARPVPYLQVAFPVHECALEWSGFITLCACAQQGLSDRFVSRLSMETNISSLSSEGLVEGLVQNRSVRILVPT